MGIVLDIVLISIFALSIFLGYRKGLIKVAFNLCAFILAILITWILYTPVTNLVLEHTNFDEGIKSSIIEKGVIKVERDEKNDDNSINNYINQYVTEPATSKANEAVEETAKVVSEKVVAIGVAIALFIVVRVVLLLLSFIADMIAKLPIIKQFNKGGGIIYGVIRGIFIIYTILAIMFFVMSVNNSGLVANAIDSSILSKFLYTHNIILDIIF